MYPATPGSRYTGTVQITFISLPLTWRTITMTLSEYFLYQCPYSSLMDAMRWWIQTWVLKKRVLWAVVWFLLLNRGIHNKNFFYTCISSTYTYIRTFTNAYICIYFQQQGNALKQVIWICSIPWFLHTNMHVCNSFMHTYECVCVFLDFHLHVTVLTNLLHTCILTNVCMVGLGRIRLGNFSESDRLTPPLQSGNFTLMMCRSRLGMCIHAYACKCMCVCMCLPCTVAHSIIFCLEKSNSLSVKV